MTSRAFRHWIAAACVATLVACRDAAAPRRPTTITVAPTTVAFDAVGATQAVTATVTDQDGAIMTGVAVTWHSGNDNATVVTVPLGDPSTGVTGRAVVTAARNGPATVTATSGAATTTLPVITTQHPTALRSISGDQQSGVVNRALPQPIVLTVVDRLGAPVAGQSVTFVATGGGGASPASAVTGDDGTAATTWTLGKTVTQPQRLVASVAGVESVSETATAVADAPASMTAIAGDRQTTGVGRPVAVPPAVLVTDAFGNPVAAATIAFTASGGGTVANATALTNAQGVALAGNWKLGSTPGSYTLTAALTALAAVSAVTFSATATPGVPPTPTTVVIASGGNQAAMAGAETPDRPSVIVRDAEGNPMSGIPVFFAVTLGGGSIADTSAITDAAGVASPGRWIVGAVAALNVVQATVRGVDSVQLAAAGCTGGGSTGYTINVCYRTPMSAAQRQTFVDAAARWRGVITSDLADVSANIRDGACDTGSPSVRMTIDDLLIFAAIEPIDGAGKILGSAGWCFRRSGALPLVGTMRFDAADVANLEASGRFGAVILHEMGHVIGIGTLWSARGLLQNPSSSTTVADTYFSGVSAVAGFDEIGGISYTGGQKVPVENTGGSGTINAHWREGVLANELMTGFLNSGTNPLSVMTIRSLEDLGYVVNASAADPFSLTLAVRASVAADPAALPYGNDVFTGPQWSIDSRGRMTRIR